MDKLETLVQAFEIISKGIMYKIELGEQEEAMDDIQWINSKILALFEKKTSDFSLFKALVDPVNRYPFREQINFDEIDWTNININVIEADSRQIKSPEPSIPTYDLNHRIQPNDLLDILSKNIIKISLQAYEKDFDNVYNMSMNVFGNLYSNVIFLDGSNLNYSLLYKGYIENLNYLLRRSLINKSQKTKFAVIYLAYISIPLDQFKQENIPIDKIEFLRESLLLTNISFLKNNKTKLVKSFIKALYSRHFEPLSSSNPYNQILALIEKPDAGEISKLYHTLFREPTIIYNKHDYLNYLLELKKLRDKYANIPSAYFQRIEKYAFDFYKYRMAQLTLYNILTYAIYDKKYNIVEFAFDYHQPGDSDAIWAGRDLTPNDLDEIIVLVRSTDNMENELMFYWQDHHGVRGYINLLIIAIIFRWIKVKNIQTLNKEIKNRFATKATSSQLEGLKSKFIYLKNSTQILEKENSWPLCDLDDDTSKKLESFFSSLIQAVEETIIVQEQSAPLNLDSISHFKKSLIDNYNKKAIYKSLIEQNGKRNRRKIDSGEIYETIGVSEIINRSIFIENWDIPSSGLIENIGRILANQENSIFEKIISNKFSPKDIELKQIKPLLDKSRGEIIITKNIDLEFALKNPGDFIPKWKMPDENEFLGGRYRGKDVFTYHRFGLDKLIFLKTPLGKYSSIIRADLENKGYTSVDEFYFQIVDYGIDDEARKSFLDTPPEWLENKFPKGQEEKREDYIKNKIWLRVFKSFIWESKKVKCRSFNIQKN